MNEKGFRGVFARLCRENKLAVASAVLIALFALAAIFAPLLTPYSFDEMDLLNRLLARLHLGDLDSGDLLTLLLLFLLICRSSRNAIYCFI